MAEVHPKSKALLIVAAVVCLAAALVSWPLGMLATMVYQLSEDGRLSDVGGVLGAVGGLLSGLLWVDRMSAATRKPPRGTAKCPSVLLALGVLWGVVSGMVATIVLHGGLMVAWGEVRLDALVVGMLVALPTGLVLGLISGLAWWLVARRHCETEPEPSGQQDAT